MLCRGSRRVGGARGFASAGGGVAAPRDAAAAIEGRDIVVTGIVASLPQPARKAWRGWTRRVLVGRHRELGIATVASATCGAWQWRSDDRPAAVASAMPNAATGITRGWRSILR